MKKDIIVLLGFTTVLIILIIGIVYLAVNNKDGWGWLVFLAFIMITGFDYRSSEDDDDNEDKENKKQIL